MKKIIIFIIALVGLITGCENKAKVNNTDDIGYQVYMFPRTCLAGERSISNVYANENNLNESVLSIGGGTDLIFPNKYYINYYYKFPLEDVRNGKEMEVKEDQWTQILEMNFTVIDIQTNEELRTVDVKEILEKNYPDYQPGNQVSPSPASTTEYNGKLAVVYVVEKKPTKEEVEKGIEAEKHNLYIGAEEDFHVLDMNSTVYMDTEVESSEYKFLESTDIFKVNGIEGYLYQTKNGYWKGTQWENTIAVGIAVSSLPENNAKLYEMFPEIKGIEMEEDDSLTFYLDEMSEEEIIKLFLEDGQEINYEGVKMFRNTKDGEEHILTSKEEIDQYYEANEFLIYEYEK